MTGTNLCAQSSGHPMTGTRLCASISLFLLCNLAVASVIPLIAIVSG